MATTTGGATATATEVVVDDSWKEAQKLRGAIQKELEHIQRGGPGAKETARFEKVEKIMQRYRLKCIEPIWSDLRAASEKGIEEALWLTHNLVTKAYRKVIGKLQGADQAVLKRKLEKLYSDYLKTSQFFYKGYLQRICARYNMKELKRIARLSDIEDMTVPEEDRIDPTAVQLEDVLTMSCQKTLVYLGDLSRYRTLLRAKDRRWDMALTYYALAHDLMPESGLPHHQCGVIHLETHNHFAIVYHFYRAAVCEKAHPNAASNLESEFRVLRRPKSLRTSGDNDALLTWFVKLHAFYFQGEDFPGQDELEKEVNHRLVRALKTGDKYEMDTNLLKMVLINIAAYMFGLKKIRAEWTDAGSRSCQFILMLNVRTIHTISRILNEELAEIARRDPAATTTKGSDKDATSKFTPTFHRALPLLRVYMTWLSFYSSDLVDYQPHLEPHFGEMCKSLGNTLTLLFKLLGSNMDLKKMVPWRFPEDEETLGISCLNGPDLHDGCQLLYDSVKRELKPRAEDVKGVDFSVDDIACTRAFDITFCAVDLAQDSKFPLMINSTIKDGQETTTFVFAEGGKPVLASQPAEQPLSSGPAAPAAVPSAVLTSVEQPLAKAPAVPPTLDDSDEFSEDEAFYGSHAQVPAGRPAQLPVNQTPQAAPVSDYPLEKQLYNILNDFMSPPDIEGTAVRGGEVQRAEETSYGMTSATAIDVFGAAAPASPALGSANKAIPTLPWNYFYNPSPTGNGAQRSPYGHDLGTWKGEDSSSLRPGSSGPAMPGKAFGEMGGSVPTLKDQQTRHRLSGQHTITPADSPTASHATANIWARNSGVSSTNFNQSVQDTNIRDMWPKSSDRSNSMTNQMPPASQSSTWGGTAAVHWQPGHNHSAAARGSTNSPFASTHFSANTSSLPSVNSPWGVSAGRTRNSFAQSTPSPLATQQSSPFANGSPTGVGYGNGQAYEAYGRGNAMAHPDRGYGFNHPSAAAYGAMKAGEYDRQALLNALANDHRQKQQHVPLVSQIAGSDREQKLLQLQQLMALQAQQLGPARFDASTTAAFRPNVTVASQVTPNGGRRPDGNPQSAGFSKP